MTGTRADGRAAATGPTGPSPTRTVVHVLRHGEVHNPDAILYGRKPGIRP